MPSNLSERTSVKIARRKAIESFFLLCQSEAMTKRLLPLSTNDWREMLPMLFNHQGFSCYSNLQLRAEDPLFSVSDCNVRMECSRICAAASTSAFSWRILLIKQQVKSNILIDDQNETTTIHRASVINNESFDQFTHPFEMKKRRRIRRFVRFFICIRDVPFTINSL